MKQLILYLLLIAGFTAQAQEVKTITSPTGDIYEGQVNAQGIPHGKGKGIFKNSHTIYEGDWENGNPNGKGRLVLWRLIDGKADTTERYVGDIVNGIITGNGTFTMVGKWEYTGGFSEGKFNGKGKKTYINKQFIGGEWKNGELVSGTYTVTSLLPFKISEWDSKRRGTIDKYGYKTEDGDVVIQAKYIGAEKFSEGMAAVRTSVLSKDYSQDWGYIDIQGNVKIDFKYITAYPFSEGLAAVGTWDNENRITIYSYIDKKGKEVIPLEYSDARPFSEGLAAVSKGEKYGYINTKGKLEIPYKFETAFEFKQDRAIVWNKDLKYGLIDKKGNQLVPCEYEFIGEFKDGMAQVKKETLLEGNEKYGYIDKTGKLVIPVIYERAFDFENGKAQVALDGRSFYIDKTGKEIKEEN